MESYRAAVNIYISHLWNTKGKLDKNTLALLPATKTRLSARYRSQALKQAMETVIATKKAVKGTHKYCSMPVFRGSATLDAKFVTIEAGKGSFDLVIKLSCLEKGKRLILPTKKTKMLNKWASKPLARIIQGCSLNENSITIWVDLPDLDAKKGDSLGVDIGINKLISSSDGSHLGTEFKALRDKIKRKKPGSKAKGRAIKERNNFIRRIVNMLPWSSLGLLAIEDLKHMKTGKQKNRGKQFRKAMMPWTYCQVIEVLKQKAQENRVHLVAVAPAYTSQTCPSCETASKGNRKAEKFCCINCGYSHDADTVGAINILVKALRLIGSVESPMLLNSQ
jgi:IS605 OrfB family transposase